MDLTLYEEGILDYLQSKFPNWQNLVKKYGKALIKSALIMAYGQSFDLDEITEDMLIKAAEQWQQGGEIALRSYLQKLSDWWRRPSVRQVQKALSTGKTSLSLAHTIHFKEWLYRNEKQRIFELAGE